MHTVEDYITLSMFMYFDYVWYLRVQEGIKFH